MHEFLYAGDLIASLFQPTIMHIASTFSPRRDCSRNPALRRGPAAESSPARRACIASTFYDRALGQAFAMARSSAEDLPLYAHCASRISLSH
jgi:hypothetical protein